MRYLLLFLCILILSCSENLDFKSVPQNEIIDISVEGHKKDDVLILDGDQFINVNVKIYPKAAKNAITLSSNILTKVEMKDADQFGNANFKIALPYSNENIKLIATVVGINDKTYSSEYFIPVKKKSIPISFEIKNDTLKADEYTVVELVGTINFNRKNFNKIKFSTNGAKFINSTNSTSTEITIDKDGKALAKLLIPNTSLIPIYNRAEIVADNAEYLETIIFLTPAKPDNIIIELDKNTLGVGENVSITLLLKRTQGKVTQGSRIEAYALQEGNTKPIGRFTGIIDGKTNAEGKLSDIKFFADTDDIDPSKPILLTFETLNDFGKKVTSSQIIKIK